MIWNSGARFEGNRACTCETRTHAAAAEARRARSPHWAPCRSRIGRKPTGHQQLTVNSAFPPRLSCRQMWPPTIKREIRLQFGVVSLGLYGGSTRLSCGFLVSSGSRSHEIVRFRPDLKTLSRASPPFRTSLPTPSTRLRPQVRTVSTLPVPHLHRRLTRWRVDLRRVRSTLHPGRLPPTSSPQWNAAGQNRRHPHRNPEGSDRDSAMRSRDRCRRRVLGVES